MKLNFLPIVSKIVLMGAVTAALPMIGGAASVTGGTTTVILNPSTVSALSGLGFTIGAIAPSTLGGMPLAATFPITGGDTTTMITHSGGLSFTKSGTTANISNFIINLSGPQANIITGTLMAGSTTQSGVAFFDIGSGLGLTLDATLAGALSSAYGVPNLTGASIGTASVSPSAATPEPTSFALMACGSIASLAFLRRRSSRTRA